MKILKYLCSIKCLCSLIVILCALGLSYILYRDFTIIFDKTQETLLADCQKESSDASVKFNTLMLRSQNILSQIAGPLENMIKSNQSREKILKFLRERDAHFKKTVDLNFVSIYGLIYDKYIDSGPWVPDSTYQPKSRLWYTEAVKGNGKIVIAPPYQDADTGQIVISMTLLLSDGKSVIGIDNYYDDVIQKINRKNHKSVVRFLLDRHENLILDASDKRETIKSENSKFFKHIRDFITQMNLLHDTIITNSINGEKCTIITHKLISNWIAVTGIRHEKITTTVLQELIPHFIISGVIALLIFILVFTGFHRIGFEHAKAIAADKSKSLFFAMVSHEIRTPLNSIIGFAKILREYELSKKNISEYLDYIVSSSETLTIIINDILDLSKLNVGKMQIVQEYCSFPKIINSVKGIFLIKAEQADNKIIIDIDDKMPVLKLDKGRIKQILFNIVGNAVKFTTNGTITISASFQPKNENYGQLVFSISDTGVGISEKILNSILDPFVSSEHQSRNQGTGLGLPICAKLLTQMNGKLDIRSEIGKGSVFTVTINRIEYKVDPNFDDNHNRMELSDTNIHKKLNLLLCDDVDLNLKVLSIVLNKQYSAVCTCVHSGKEVLAKLESEKYDALITDMWMPEMNGEELLKAIRKNPELDNLPVYVISADVLILDNWKKIGFSGIITKPISTENINYFYNDMKNLYNTTTIR